MSRERLSGSIALVTGGAAGIGAAISAQLVREGCKAVYMMDIVQEPPFEGVSNKDALHYHQVDVTSIQEVKRILEEIESEHGCLDVLVNNAAAFVYEAIEDLSEEAMDKTFAVNVKAPGMLIKLAVPLLKHSKAGSVINVSSINAMIAHAGFVPYAASKGAISQLTRNAAVDLGKFGIRVNSVVPGAILTEATAKHAAADGKTLDTLVEELKNRHALPKMGRVEDIAMAVAFLASSDAAFITGHGLVVDGGFTIR